ncbi:MAG: alpha/beta hydrolase [Chloroflexi bacterium]|nr:alpha/beta hydrolase [Chloroflexota bacterium]
MSAIVLGDGLVHYEVLGRGKPLILLHGWIGSWRYWMSTMEDLSSGYRVYAPDLWGFGDSDKRRSAYTVRDYVAQLDTFLSQLGVDEVSLVGHSLGGAIALEFATSSPDRVKRVVGVGVPFNRAAVARALVNASTHGEALVKLATRRATYPEIDLEVRKTDMAAVAHSVASLAELDLYHSVQSLRIPVLLVYGEQDPLVRWPGPDIVPDDAADRKRVFCLTGAQHFPMLEQRNKFSRLLLDFLENDGDLATLTIKQEWQRRLR